MTINPRTPVLVGIGIVEQKLEDPAAAEEAIALMIEAVRRAGSDAGVADQLPALERVMVPQGLWHYGDPGRMVADAVGAANARTVFAKVGVMQQTLLNDTCRGIEAGDFDIGVVVGGEAKYRDLRAQITGVEVPVTANEDCADLVMEPDEELYHELEVEALGYMPVGYYAIMENAFRAANDWTVAEHRDRLARLYSRFSEIAADNPHAWKRERVEPAVIRDASPRNRMLAFPYTKLHNTSWNVDQASALLYCSAAKAQELGIPREKWVFPRSSAESNHMLSLAQKPDLHSLPGARFSGARAMELAGLEFDDLDLVELYSCFPIAVEMYRAEIGLPDGIDLTVTGGMPFAGGPVNNYVLQSTCRMAELLRQDGASHGLLSSVSGLLTKQSFAVWSTEPGPAGFEFADVTEAVRGVFPPCDVAEGYRGEGRIIGYTVRYEGEQPSRAVVVLELPDGSHTLAWSEEAEVMEAMQNEEYCGRTVVVGENRFTP